MNATRRIASNLLFDGECISRNPIVEIDSPTGRVISVTHYDTDIDRMEGVEFHSGLLCPAFVNCHCHTELSHLRGKTSMGGGMSRFAGEVAALRDVDRSLRLEAACQAIAEMDRNGIAMVGDISDDGIALPAGRPETHTFLEVFGLRTSNIEIQTRRTTETPASSLTPHSMYSISDEDLRKVAYEGDYPLSVHFLESEEERLLFEGKGPMAEWFVRQRFDAGFLGRYASPTERLIRCTPRDRDIILVHSGHATARDIDMVMDHFTGKVHWVVCPKSNLYIHGDHISATAVASTAGLDLCLGTDSLASNTELSILDELKSVNCGPLERWLRAATSCGAEALRAGDRWGHIRTGVAPGLVVIGGILPDLSGISDKAEARRII